MKNWYSTPHNMQIKVREPTLLEHFASTALKTFSQVLVRESIQNSLDAALIVNGVRQRPVRVRIFISELDGALSRDQAKKWFGHLWPHLLTPQKGLRNLPAENDPCPFVVIEDFGTSGLHGAYDRNYVEENEISPWISFFHKEGDSSKQESDRGRWGMGKVVFPGSSRIHTFLASTVREDGKILMMGQSMLRSRVLDNKRYLPDVWLCASYAENQPLMPIEDTATIEEFRKDFHLNRREETGLSVVVPYVQIGNQDSDDPGITFDSILDAVIVDYFLPILRGELVVTIDTPNRTNVIDENTLPGLIQTLNTPSVEFRRPEIDLAAWSLSCDSSRITINEHASSGAVKWDETLITDEMRSRLKPIFESGKPLAIRIPVRIRPKVGSESKSYFDVYLQRTGESNVGRPLFIREGLIIPDVKPGRTRGVRSLVIAEDGGIATLLGDAENPAHTEWQAKSSNFKDKYNFGPSYLQFVINSVEKIVARLATEVDVEDPTLLLDIFSLPPDEEDDGHAKKQPTQKGEKPEIPPHEPRTFNVTRSADGFVVRRGDLNARIPKRVVIRAAYHVRRGDPFSRWMRADFILAKMAETPTDASPLEMAGNRMVYKITGPNFEIPFGGFGQLRDLRVDVKTQEADDEADI